MTNIALPAWTGDHLLTADARKVSGVDFARSLGLNIRSPEQKAAEWRAECERYADMIECGKEGAVSPPYLWDARRIVEERAQLTECLGDPLLRRRA